MTRFDIMRILRQFKENNKDKYRILQMGLFGSVAKGTMGRESDVDVVVELEKQDLWHIIGIKQDLEEILLMPVDIVSYREKMNVFLKSRIDQEAIYV